MSALEPLLPGYVLHERYRILRRIGGGGFGQVYHALDLWKRGFVAVKESTDMRPEAAKRLLEEIGLLGALRHPALPRLFDRFAEPDGRLYFVMTFVPGLNLRELRAARPLSEAQAVGWIAELCSVLSYLHGYSDGAVPRPVVHLDVKPENLIPGEAFPGLVLVDFGIAAYAGQRPRGITRGYAAPEQHDAGCAASPQCDIFGAGATLIYLLTGIDPPDAALPDWRNRLAGLIRRATDDAALAAVLTKATAAEPARRFATAAELGAALRLMPCDGDGSRRMEV